MTREYQSEAELEDQLMKRLNALGYKTIKLQDEKAVIAHFRDVLNERNRDRLKGKVLTDTEFTRALNELTGSKTIYQMAQLLRGSDYQPKGKIVITRDDNSEVYLEFFDGTNFEQNKFEVAHQITVNAKYTNRYDVTILINGLPIVQVELKRRGVELPQAFNQIIRYRNESFRQLFRFIQIFVISNGEDTRYFANNDGKLNSNFMFYWTDKKNHWLNEINAFSASFFDRRRLHSLIARYTIFDSDAQRILVMRPYQVYAVEAIIDRVQNHPGENGYIWHTTGSGKTITAFKASQIIAQKTDAKKVIFLIDRSDLDTQTADNFNAYLPQIKGESRALDRIDSTKMLVEQLQSKSNPLIVTTIQKLNYAIQNDRYKDLLTPYHDAKVVFIEDEAHRSQFGEMRKGINRWFKNAQHIGFTGTPIFAENVGQDGRTTETLYGECLHQYLIKDAIRDRNVLGFSMQYLNTIHGKDVFLDGNEMVSGIDKKEVMEADDRLEMIVQHILLNHGQITHNRHYNAILAVPSTRVALKYYELFKKLDPEHQLHVTTIFTWEANEKDNEEKQDSKETLTSRHGLESVIKDYNQMFETNFSTDKFKDYFNDVSRRMKQFDYQTPETNIDVLIVVNMFLTGFDSPKLSTLYIDKKLQWHNLIQAFSRTNRIELDSKPFGNILAYRNMKQDTDNAVRLFSAGSSESLFVPSYDELQGQFDDAVEKLREISPTPQSVDNLHDLGDEALQKFVLAFREILRIYNKIRVYDEFDFGKMADFSHQDMESYRSKYATAYQELIDGKEGPDPSSVLDDIDFEIELIAADTIDVGYIVNLIHAINLKDEDERRQDTRRIKKMLINAADPNLQLKSDLLQAFLEEIVPKLDPEDNVGNELNQYLIRKREESVKNFSEEVHLPEEVIKKEMDDVSFYGEHVNTKALNEALNANGLKFMEKRTVKSRVKTFVTRALKKFVLS
ncbi:type I restriction-modification system restriction subunit R [Secundilactobacillus pentosiphilus]|uniref:Type I restriction enzyme endonuclease subunit n=1 Tax=Secundilactobacillus pentosiphilus TaxID=1714682 RepID=A0A1Z5IZF0_9LACO|nr:type I restriction endonuclease subunit R [Secundilactobacillus pentosiphilus]GAX07143.1 type I restriction-modification system restriction subunit R [Secundilactobacillus pentosiphilus]